MMKLLLLVCVALLCVTPADGRRRRRHRHIAVPVPNVPQVAVAVRNALRLGGIQARLAIRKIVLRNRRCRRYRRKLRKCRSRRCRRRFQRKYNRCKGKAVRKTLGRKRFCSYNRRRLATCKSRKCRKFVRRSLRRCGGKKAKRSCRRLSKRLRRCKTRRCRRRARRALKRCNGGKRKRSCRRLSKRLRRCKNRKCRKIARRALKRCNGGKKKSTKKNGCKRLRRRLSRCKGRKCRRRARRALRKGLSRRLRRCKSRNCRRRVRRSLKRCAGGKKKSPKRVSCRFLRRRLSRCKTRRCRKRATRALRSVRKCRRGLKIVRSCTRLRRRLSRCSSRRCRKLASRQLRRRGCSRRRRSSRRLAGRRRRSSRRLAGRRRRAVFTKKSCKKYGRIAHRLRKAIKRAERRAAKCGDASTACVSRSYKRVAKLRFRLASLNRVCRKSAIKFVQKKAAVQFSCKHFRRWIRHQRRRRNRLQVSVARCGDEDSLCVSRLMAKVLALNKRISKHSKRCRVTLHPRKVTVSLIRVGPWVYSSQWKHEVTCDRMKRKWNEWIAFQNRRRRRLHAESCQCSPFDSNCLRIAFTQIIHIQRAVRDARTVYADHLAGCDRCASIKIRFSRWLQQARARRLRIHQSLCLCRVEDENCAARRVARIKALTKRMRERRLAVTHLHRNCRLSFSTTTRTTAASTPVPYAPPARFSVLGGMGSVASVSALLLALVLALVF